MPRRNPTQRNSLTVKRFDIVEHTADAGIVAYGRDLKEAFANAAYGMFSLAVELDGVGESVGRRVEVRADDIESLVISWLNELLYILDVEGTVFKRFDILELTETSLKADVRGERLDPSRHAVKAGLKAATYHMLKVETDRDGYSIRVIFDA